MTAATKAAEHHRCFFFKMSIYQSNDYFNAQSHGTQRRNVGLDAATQKARPFRFENSALQSVREGSTPMRGLPEGPEYRIFQSEKQRSGAETRNVQADAHRLLQMMRITMPVGTYRIRHLGRAPLAPIQFAPIMAAGAGRREIDP
ncbi:MAG: hypothetical protein AAFY49_01030 [Pseudomonadota bacterium]